MRADLYEWNITLTEKQVELRKSFGGNANVLIIVSDNGWTRVNESPKAKEKWNNTSGFDVRFSMNGVAWLTFEDWDDVKRMVSWAEEEVLRPRTQSGKAAPLKKE